MPMITSSTGSMSVMKRPSVVSISSSKKSATAFNMSRSAPVDSPTSTILTATGGKSPHPCIEVGQRLALADLARDRSPR